MTSSTLRLAVSNILQSISRLSIICSCIADRGSTMLSVFATRLTKRSASPFVTKRESIDSDNLGRVFCNDRSSSPIFNSFNASEDKRKSIFLSSHCTPDRNSLTSMDCNSKWFCSSILAINVGYFSPSRVISAFVPTKIKPMSPFTFIRDSIILAKDAPAPQSRLPMWCRI